MYQPCPRLLLVEPPFCFLVLLVLFLVVSDHLSLLLCFLMLPLMVCISFSAHLFVFFLGVPLTVRCLESVGLIVVWIREWSCYAPGSHACDKYSDADSWHCLLQSSDDSFPASSSLYCFIDLSSHCFPVFILCLIPLHLTHFLLINSLI